MDHKKDQPTVNLNLGAAPAQKMIPEPPSPSKPDIKQHAVREPKLNLIDQLDSIAGDQPMDSRKQPEYVGQESNPLMTHQYRKPTNAMLQKRWSNQTRTLRERLGR